ncbi:MAG: GNAT family N-acetyltransferase [Steroidobacteraceae bacterium]|nr:GNAT family N-acetyltransferase [Steroidobacteraceae bacterium]
MKATANDTHRYNEYGQPIGFELTSWSPPPFPPHEPKSGRYARLAPLNVALHARDIFDAQRDDPNGERWTYSFSGPFADLDAYEKWMTDAQTSRDPQHYAIVDAASGRAVGTASYLRIDPRHGVIEVGNIYFSPRLARTRAATESIYLFIASAFDLGYRRFEWKCDSCNLPSRAAAPRFGFTYEGTFRQAIVNKGRNRDTTWFSIIDGDWNGGLKAAFERWLDPANFDTNETQKSKLSELTASFVYARS